MPFHIDRHSTMTSPQQVKGNPEDVQEEERLEDDLEHLKILHLKVTISVAVHAFFSFANRCHLAATSPYGNP